jgi:arabinan endo-1,5-alpha-L-arabinosidase
MKTRSIRQFVHSFDCIRLALLLVASLLLFETSFAQNAPSHDPSRIIRNTDGRYWIFTTGDGIWAMSSSNPDFTDWRPENPVFPIGSWPSWIGNYVSGFNGFFWAPDIIKVGSTYRLYYSCAGQGAPAAIGLATATNLAGPWTDQGLIVAGDNAIDPAPFIDSNGSHWMTWGNWQTGIDLLQISSSTGKRSGTSRWDIVPGQVEAPYLHKNGSYYYLFFQKGLCCNGLNSSYYTVVARSTSITGPYVDKNGTKVSSGGGSVFLPNKDRRFVGPGHVGIAEGRMTYHFYDGNDNGAAKLRTTYVNFVNGWPVAEGVYLSSSTVSDGTYRIRNRTSGKYLDNLGSTSDGALAAQWTSGSSYNQRWIVTTNNGYRRIRSVTGGKYLDNINNTADGSAVAMWSDSPNFNQQWSIMQVGSYYKILNRSNVKAVDTGGQTADGSFMQFWPDNPNFNQQWTFEKISSSTSATAGSSSSAKSSSAAKSTSAASTAVAATTSSEFAVLEVHISQPSKELSLSAPKASGWKQVTVEDRAGRIWAQSAFSENGHTLSVANVPAGRYSVRVIDDAGRVVERPVLIKR